MAKIKAELDTDIIIEDESIEYIIKQELIAAIRAEVKRQLKSKTESIGKKIRAKADKILEELK